MNKKHSHMAPELPDYEEAGSNNHNRKEGR